MITILKFLLLLFVSLLANDTIQLFLQHSATYTDSEPSICPKTPDESLDLFSKYYLLLKKELTENKDEFYLKIGCLAAIIIAIIFLVKKNRIEQDNKLTEIINHLKYLSHNNVVNTKSILSCHRTIFDEPKGMTDQCSTQTTNSLPPFSNIDEHFSSMPGFVQSQSENVSLFNSRQENNYPSALTPEDYLVAFDDQVETTYLLSDISNWLMGNCNTQLCEFKERLEEVENNVKSNKKVTVMWKDRIEQTEEELLELQQQIQCMLLEWTFRQTALPTLPSKINEGETSQSKLEYMQDYLPLKILSEIIEDSKKQMEVEEGSDLLSLGKNQLAEAGTSQNRCEQIALLPLNSTGITRNVKTSMLTEEDTPSNNTNEPLPLTAVEKKNEVKKESFGTITNLKEDEVSDISQKSSASQPTTPLSTIHDQQEELYSREKEKRNNLLRRHRKLRLVESKVPSHIFIPHRNKSSPRPPPRCAYSILPNEIYKTSKDFGGCE